MNSSNVIIPGKGAAFIAEPGATPVNYKTVTPSTLPVGWKSLGHTSVENQVALSKEGGEATIYDSWWEAAIDVTRSPNQWGVTVNALELSKDNFDIAFNGELETTTETGGYLVPADVVAVEKALFILAVQGTKRMGVYFPKVSMTLGDAPEFDRESLFELPLSASIMTYEGAVMEWFHPALDKVAAGA
jgi:hypothetical protein